MKDKLLPIFMEKVCSILEISRGDLFSQTKEQDNTTARQLIWALAHYRNIAGIKITSFMNTEGEPFGYSVTNSTVSKGVRSFMRKMEMDTDLRILFNKLKDESIF